MRSDFRAVFRFTGVLVYQSDSTDIAGSNMIEDILANVNDVTGLLKERRSGNMSNFIRMDIPAGTYATVAL
jgi:hypothetical protein